MMFGDTRDEFPVDTHVWRITRERLQWAPKSATREATYEHLNRRIPAELKYDLHVLLVTHGKHCPRCAKNGKNRREALGECPLLKLQEHVKLHYTTCKVVQVSVKSEKLFGTKPQIKSEKLFGTKPQIKSEFTIKIKKEDPIKRDIR